MDESAAEKRWVELLRKPDKTEEELREKEIVGEIFLEELAREEKPLLEDLSKVGLGLSSVYDLVNTKERYPQAIDILVGHLPRDYHLKIKEGIIRALAVKEAVGKATPTLIAEYNKLPKEKSNLRWIIGNTVYNTITASDLGEILEIVLDRDNGYTRRPFVLALGKIKSDQAETTLISLLSDDEVVLQALGALLKTKSVRARSKAAELVDHPNVQVRKLAKKLLGA